MQLRLGEQVVVVGRSPAHQISHDILRLVEAPPGSLGLAEIPIVVGEGSQHAHLAVPDLRCTPSVLGYPCESALGVLQQGARHGKGNAIGFRRLDGGADEIRELDKRCIEQRLAGLQLPPV